MSWWRKFSVVSQIPCAEVDESVERRGMEIEFRNGCQVENPVYLVAVALFGVFELIAKGTEVEEAPDVVPVGCWLRIGMWK